jgi:AcrR family transcriptional regulator
MPANLLPALPLPLSAHPPAPHLLAVGADAGRALGAVHRAAQAAQAAPAAQAAQAAQATRATVRLLASVVGMQPQANQLPGGALLQNLMDGLQFWALALALVGLVIGAAAWALGSHGQNYQQTYVGRRAVLISGLAALLIGAGPGIVNFFYTAGTGVHGG